MQYLQNRGAPTLSDNRSRTLCASCDTIWDPHGVMQVAFRFSITFERPCSLRIACGAKEVPGRSIYIYIYVCVCLSWEFVPPTFSCLTQTGESPSTNSKIRKMKGNPWILSAGGCQGSNMTLARDPKQGFGGTQEAPRRRPGVPRRHPGGAQGAPRRHPGAPRSPEGS